jgi:hypothetical protein
MRDLIEKRLLRGYTQEDIRCLLKLPSVEHHLPQPIQNQDLLTATYPLTNQNEVQSELQTMTYPNNPINEAQNATLSMQHITIPSMPAISAPSNTLPTFPLQFDPFQQHVEDILHIEPPLFPGNQGESVPSSDDPWSLSQSIVDYQGFDQVFSSPSLNDLNYFPDSSQHPSK